MAEPDRRSVRAPDGQTLVVVREPTDLWVCWLEGKEDHPVGGEDKFLSGLLADALGYRVGAEELPDWIDDLAAQVRASFGP